MTKLDGKVAIITGSTSGIGRATAGLFFPVMRPIAPGVKEGCVDGSRTQDGGSDQAFPGPEKAVSETVERTLLGRLGTPEEVARAALFLACSDSKWVTGTAHTVDGGIMA